MLEIHKNYQLGDLIFYKIPVVAEYFVKVNSSDEILEVFEFCYKNKIERIMPLGLGSNVLFSSERFKGLVFQIAITDIKNKTKNITLRSDGKLVVFGGVILDDIIKYSFKNGLIGLEWAGGLPGTVGAGLRGNVGAFGGEIKDVVVEADVVWWREDGGGYVKRQTLTNKEIRFAYRDSLVKQTKGVVINVTLQLNKTLSSSLLTKAKNKYYEHIAYRLKNHPLDYPNCGSVFKNIRDKKNVEIILNKWPDLKVNVEKKWYGKIPIGYIINRFNLTGFKSGGAQISLKHANFIINTGGAKARDILDLIARVKDKFLTEFGFEPEVEIEII